jgi:hypothetical protein
MSTVLHQAVLSSDQVLRITNEDAIRVYGTVSDFQVAIRLHPDGWHVEYEPVDTDDQGGGPHYVIDATDGTIVSKKYYQ